jgi:two-component system LytT family response regulator
MESNISLKSKATLTVLTSAFGSREITVSIKKILIVDDESLARDRVRRFLLELNIQAQVEEAKDGLQALEKLTSLKPDVVFLDIQMPGLNGFEVLQHIEDRSFHLIFQTAYDEYALKAFDENACDYLLKPIQRDRFEKALGKVLSLQAQKEGLKNLELEVQKKHGFLDKLAVKHSGKTSIVDMASVDCFVSRDHYTCIYSGSSEFITELSLNWLEERIDPEKWVRCHRSGLIPIGQIKAISGVNDSEVELKNGMRLPLSRNNRKKVFSLFRPGN